MNRIALGLAWCAAAGAANAGVYVELVDHDLRTNTTDLAQKMYVQSGSGRFVDPDGRVSIIKAGNMYVIDDAEKSYYMLDQATMTKLAEKVKAGMERAKEQVAKLPPEERARYEQMLGGAGMQWTVDVADTGKSDKVDGRTCRLWDVKRNGELDNQLCVVPYSALPGKEDLQKVFASFAKVFEQMASSLPMLAGMMSNEFSAQSKVNGFPVRTRAYHGGELGDSEQLVKVWREEAIPASMFEIPAGYARKELDMGPGAH